MADLNMASHLCIMCFCPDLEHQCKMPQTTSFPSLSYLCSFFQDTGNSRLVILYSVGFCVMLGGLFLCYSMLLHFGGHRDLRTLKALPDLVLLKFSILCKKKVFQFLLKLMLAPFAQKSQKAVETLMNNISVWINIDEKNISIGNKLSLVMFSKVL